MFNVKKEEKVEIDHQSTSAAVKKKYGESNRLVDYLNKKHNEKDTFILSMFARGGNKDQMWDYVKRFEVQMPYKGLSDIRVYINKRGEEKMAHYNGSKFMCLVKTDTSPKECVKWAVPTQEEWIIDGLGKFIKKEEEKEEDLWLCDVCGKAFITMCC